MRSRAKALGVQPDRIGVLGMSAGGYLVAQTSNILEPAYRPVDDIDRISSRPDFAVALYRGHLCRCGANLDPTIHVTRQTPPTFLLQAWDDPVDPVCNSTLYARALDAADAPTEVHLFAKGGHAFTLRDKSHPVGMWPGLVERWLGEIGVLRRAGAWWRGGASARQRRVHSQKRAKALHEVIFRFRIGWKNTVTKSNSVMLN